MKNVEKWEELVVLRKYLDPEGRKRLMEYLKNLDTARREVQIDERMESILKKWAQGLRPTERFSPFSPKKVLRGSIVALTAVSILLIFILALCKPSKTQTSVGFVEYQEIVLSADDYVGPMVTSLDLLPEEVRKKYGGHRFNLWKTYIPKKYYVEAVKK